MKITIAGIVIIAAALESDKIHHRKITTRRQQ